MLNRYQEVLYINLFVDDLYPSRQQLSEKKLTKIVLLENVAHICQNDVEKISSYEFANRMRVCINYEFHRFHQYHLSASWVPFIKAI